MNTTVNERPRAAPGVPTNTRPCRRRGGSCVSVESRGVSTSRTSRRRTGPMAASGASSRSTRSTRSGFAITRGASRSRAFSQSPQICDGGQSAISARIGSANDRSARNCSRSRISARTRDASGSSELASRTRRSYSCSRPLSRRCQRSSRPITAASTIRSSQRQGARSVPATSRSVSPRIVAAWASSSGCTSSARSSGGSTASTSSSAGGDHKSASLASESGTWPSDTYSANRRADSSSSAHASRARSARPAGSGRRVPRWNHAGMPARSRACSSTPR